MKIYQTENFILYPFNKYDSKQQKFIDELIDNDVEKYVGNLKNKFYTYEPSNSFWNNDFFVGLNDNLIGYVHIFDKVYPILRYAIHPDFRGKSYGTKILLETSDYIFANYKKVKEIELSIAKTNIHSINAAEAAGFIHTEDTSYHKKR